MQHKKLTYWTDNTCCLFPRVFVGSWSADDGLTRSVDWLAGAHSSPAQQRCIITTLAVGLSRCGRPTRGTGKRLCHGSFWTVSSYARQTNFIHFKSLWDVFNDKLTDLFQFYSCVHGFFLLHYLLDTADTG